MMTSEANQIIPGDTKQNTETVIIWKGQRRTISEWSKKLNISKSRLRHRLREWGLCDKAMHIGPLNHTRGPGKKQPERPSLQSLKKDAPAPGTIRACWDNFLYGRAPCQRS